MSGVLAALGLAYVGAAKFTHPFRHLPAANPSDLGLAYEEVRLLTEDGLHVAAWYIPNEQRPALILIHGIGGNRSQHLGLGRELAHSGYGVLLLELRAHGASDGGASTLGLNEIRDVRAALDYLRQRADVDKQRVGIFGSSLGGSVAIMAAAELPELRAVVADSTFASVEWLIVNQFNTVVGLPEWLAPAVVGIGFLQTGVDPRLIAPVDRIAKISPRPVMIIHGEKDPLFSMGNANLLAAAAREPKEFWVIPGIGHDEAFAKVPQLYVSRVTGFFDGALK